MKIEHVGLFVKDLEGMKSFYEKYFGATSGEKYHNPKTTFQSYFLTFDDGARLEICTKNDLSNVTENHFGYAHLAFSVGSKEKVDEFAAKFDSVKSGPRTTGDGYYECVILDPEGNEIEITI